MLDSFCLRVPDADATGTMIPTEPRLRHGILAQDVGLLLETNDSESKTWTRANTPVAN